MKRIASWLPTWMGSIRVRLTVLYSTVLFGLASAVVGGIYLGLSRSLEDQPVTQTWTLGQLSRTATGQIQFTRTEMLATLSDFELAVNQRALDQLERYSLFALLTLFVVSLIVGWFVAGRVLRPIDRITNVAREIQATDLSRRIRLQGPDDELRDLADTFDDMLDRLDVAFESQRRFIHEASHELRNPLAIMRANLDVALADDQADVTDLRETAEIVNRSALRMTRLVDDLLTWARQENLSLRTDPVNVGVAVRGVAREFETPAAAQGVTVRCGVENDLWAIGDGPALGRAVANLLANALRVSIAGTVIHVRAGRQGNLIFIEVEDQGPGIALEHQEKIFQRFWRGNKSQSREESRSGLGLTIVRQIAEAHGGTVVLDSKLNHGATFRIRIPAVAADAPTVPLVLDLEK